MLRRTPWVALAAAPLLLTGCGDATGPEDTARVRVAFTTTAPTVGSVDGLSASLLADERVLTGSNGTLRITDMRMIVAELELEGPEACLESDDDGELELEECEFEAPPFLLTVPLEGGEVVVASTDVPLGTYSELKFEIEDLELDEDDEDRTRQAITNLRSQLQAAFPAFPSEASAVVVGSFTPTGGAARPFVVFLDADVEVELDLAPPLVIDDAGASRTLTVQLDPAAWFLDGGRVLDLSALNGRLVELEEEFRSGIRRGDDDD